MSKHSEWSTLPNELQPSLQTWIRKRLAIAAIAVVVAASLLAATYQSWDGYRTADQEVGSTGVILDVIIDQVRTPYRGTDTLTVVVTAEPGRPRFVEVNSRWGQSFGNFRKGDVISVLYSANHPNYVRLVDQPNFPDETGLLIGVAFFASIMAWGLSTSAVRAMRSASSPGWVERLIDWQDPPTTQPPRKVALVSTDRRFVAVNPGRVSHIDPTTPVWVCQVGIFVVIVPSDGGKTVAHNTRLRRVTLRSLASGASR